MDTTEQTPEQTPVKQPLYKKLLGLGILAAVVIYCFPELQETLRESADSLKKEWRDRHDKP